MLLGQWGEEAGVCMKSRVTKNMAPSQGLVCVCVGMKDKRAEPACKKSSPHALAVCRHLSVAGIVLWVEPLLNATSTLHSGTKSLVIREDLLCSSAIKQVYLLVCGVL